MEVFLLAAITSFMLTSAAISFEQPRNLRTRTVACYFGGTVALGIVLLVALVAPSPEDWTRYSTRMTEVNIQAAAVSLVFGFFTGVSVFLVRERRAARRWCWGALLVFLAASILHLVVAYLKQVVEHHQWAGFFGSVGIWILSAIAGWLLMTALRSTNQPHNTKTGFLYVLGTLSLFAAMMLFVARTTDWLDFWKTQISYRVTGLEMLDLVLGAAFGWLVRHWKQQWNTRQDMSGYPWAGGVLLAVPLFAAVAPQLLALVTSITGLKTPFAELQFSPSRTEYRAAFDVARDKAIFEPDTLKNIEGMVDRDLEYAKALSTLVMELPNYLKKDSKDSAKPSIAEEAQKLVLPFKPLFECLKAGAEEMADPHAIEDALRPSASVLSLLLRSLPKPKNPLALEKRKEAELALDERKKQVLPKPKNSLALEKRKEAELALDERKKQVMEAVEEAHEKIAGLLADRQQCPKASKKLEWPSDVDAARQSEGPYIYYLAASFQLATRNLDRAIDILETIVPTFGQHPSLNFLLAFGMYYGDREFDDVIHYTREAFAGVTERAKNIERASTSNSKPKEGFPKLQEWAKPAEFHAKNLLAYMAAQAGKYEIMAERFAEENYKNLDSMTYSNLWNNSDRVAFADTYGYVLMAIGARKSPIDVTAIQRAHRLLVEARSAARRLSLKDRRVAEVTIESHLRQAEKLLAQVR